jgi:chemotaxis protein CheD
MDIGARNAEAVRGVLSAMRSPIVAEDIGGTDGRTMRYVVGRGKVFVRRLGMSEEEL